MLATRFRSATPADVASSDRAPDTLSSRLTFAAAVSAGVFLLIWLPSRSVAAAAGVAGGLFALSAWSNLRQRSDVRALRRQLEAPDSVEVVEVRASRVLEVFSPTGPGLCFDCGDGQLLLLAGQWLLEPALYRAPEPADDGNQDRFNLLDDPHGFPSEHFALHRWRGEARPFWIEVLGRYLAPPESSTPLPVAGDFAEVLRGGIDTVQSDLERAFEARGAR